MPIINQNLDISLQKISLKSVFGPVVNGTSLIVGVVENNMIVTDCRVFANGVSGTPTGMLGVFRFTQLSGAMSFIIGSTFAMTAYSTSGYMSFTLPAAGSSLLTLIKGDQVVFTQTGGTGAATVSTIVDVVVQNVQDIVSWY